MGDCSPHGHQHRDEKAVFVTPLCGYAVADHLAGSCRGSRTERFAIYAKNSDSRDLLFSTHVIPHPRYDQGKKNSVAQTTYVCGTELAHSHRDKPSAFLPYPGITPLEKRPVAPLSQPAGSLK